MTRWRRKQTPWETVRCPLGPFGLFDKRWALQLLDKVLAGLQAEFATAGKAEQFERLKTLLTAERDTVPYRDLAAKLGMTDSTATYPASLCLHRSKKRCTTTSRCAPESGRRDAEPLAKGAAEVERA